MEWFWFYYALAAGFALGSIFTSKAAAYRLWLKKREIQESQGMMLEAVGGPVDGKTLRLIGTRMNFAFTNGEKDVPNEYHIYDYDVANKRAVYVGTNQLPPVPDAHS